MSPLAGLTGALVYLRITSLAGVVKSRLRRLRQPKYMAGALVVLAYVYFFFVTRFQEAQTRGRAVDPRALEPSVPWAELLPIVGGLGALGLLVIAIVSWIIPRRAALAFSEAEIAFLFPAPVSRRTLIHYRLLSSQAGLAFTALVFTLVFRRSTGVTGHPLIQGVGWWVILATLNLHFTGSSFAMTKLLNPTLTSMRRRVLVLATGAVAIVGLMVWTWLAIQPPAAHDLQDGFTVIRYITAQLENGPLPWVLAIPRLVMAPYLAATFEQFAMALGPALLILVIHYFWVLNTEVSFEESTIERAEKRAALVRSLQQGDWRVHGKGLKPQRAPFRLADGSRPELAFLWKNLIAMGPLGRPIGLLALLAILVGGTLWMQWRPPFPGAESVALGPPLAIIILVFLLGSLVARQDLRADLLNADILKTYPLRGWQVVLGELLTPVCVLTALVWIALLSLAVGEPLPFVTRGLQTAILIGVAIVTPAVCAIQLLVPNAVAVVLPAWAQTMTNRHDNGLEVMGQRLLALLGQVFITLIALLPAAVAAAILFAIASWLIGPATGVIVSALALVAVLGVELLLGVRWLGGRFEKFDLSAELRP